MKIALLLKTLSEKKYFLPPDVFERHKIISQLIPHGATILDVGGSLSCLKDFSPGSFITTADVKPPADLIYNGQKIPAKDESFDIVTAIDVLEHIDKKDRAGFIAELTRVSKKFVIISAPYGSQKHIAYERETLQRYPNIPYLTEHVAKGLPTPEEIQRLSAGHSSKLFYAGDLRLTNLLFRLHNFEATNHYLNSLIFFGKLLVYFFTNLITRTDSTPKSNTNRFYLVISR